MSGGSHNYLATRLRGRGELGDRTEYQRMEQRLLDDGHVRAADRVNEIVVLLIQAERERDKYRTELEQSKKEREAHELSLIENQAYAEIESDITQAVKELGHDVKVTPRLLRRIAERMLVHIGASDDPQDFRRVPAKEARDEVLSEGKALIPELLSVLPISEVLALLPKKVREAIRASDVEDAVSQMPKRIREQTGQVEKPRKTKEKRMSTDDFFQRMEKKLK